MEKSKPHWYKRAKSLTLILGAAIGGIYSQPSYGVVTALQAPITSTTPVCYIFVHGRQDTVASFASYAAAREYWAGSNMNMIGNSWLVSGSGDAVATIATKRGKRFYVVGYDGQLGYKNAAKQVADHLANAMGISYGPNAVSMIRQPVSSGSLGFKYGGGKDGGGNSCLPNSKYIIVSHSMGNTVMDFILGNAVAGSPNLDYQGAPFSKVAPLINSVHSLAGAHRGSQAADSVQGTGGIIDNFIAKFISKPTESTLWLQTASNYQVAGQMGPPIRPMYLYSGYEAMAQSGFLPGEDDGVIAHVSSHACSADPNSSMNNSTVCNNNAHMKASGYYNMSTAHENHSDIRNNSDIDERKVVPEGRKCSSKVCKKTFLGITLSSYACSGTPEEVACYGF